MSRIFTLAGVALAAIFVGVAGMGMTATTAKAQSAVRPTDVRVINTAAQSVPVAVQGTPTVNVGNSPFVNVANTPNVAVTSLPAVQIGNDGSSPVPVTVTNAASSSTIQPFSHQFTLGVPDTAFSVTSPPYFVPEDKVLVIEQISGYVINTTSSTVQHRFFLTTQDDQGSGASAVFSPDDFFDLDGGISRQHHIVREVKVYARPGTQINVGVFKNGVGTGQGSFGCAITLQGHFVDAPPAG